MISRAIDWLIYQIVRFWTAWWISRYYGEVCRYGRLGQEDLRPGDSPCIGCQAWDSFDLIFFEDPNDGNENEKDGSGEGQGKAADAAISPRPEEERGTS